mgnify:CR=1 FL=1
MEDKEQLNNLKVEVYDARKEHQNLVNWVMGLSTLLEMEDKEITLEKIYKAIEALKQ